jgi:hypothetical protein
MWSRWKKNLDGRRTECPRATETQLQQTGQVYRSISAARNRLAPLHVAVFGKMLRVQGDFTLLQSDHELKPVVVAGDALISKNELKLSFEMVARHKQHET